MSFEKLVRQANALGVGQLQITIDVALASAPGEAAGGNTVQAQAFTSTGKSNAYGTSIEVALARVLDNMQRHPIASEPNPGAVHYGYDPTDADRENTRK